jgi:hypothetical protein
VRRGVALARLYGVVGGERVGDNALHRMGVITASLQDVTEWGMSDVVRNLGAEAPGYCHCVPSGRLKAFLREMSILHSKSALRTTRSTHGPHRRLPARDGHNALDSRLR